MNEFVNKIGRVLMSSWVMDETLNEYVINMTITGQRICSLFWHKQNNDLPELLLLQKIRPNDTCKWAEAFLSITMLAYPFYSDMGG